MVTPRTKPLCDSVEMALAVYRNESDPCSMSDSRPPGVVHGAGNWRLDAFLGVETGCLRPEFGGCRTLNSVNLES